MFIRQQEHYNMFIRQDNYSPEKVKVGLTYKKVDDVYDTRLFRQIADPLLDQAERTTKINDMYADSILTCVCCHHKIDVERGDTLFDAFRKHLHNVRGNLDVYCNFAETTYKQLYQTNATIGFYKPQTPDEYFNALRQRTLEVVSVIPAHKDVLLDKINHAFIERPQTEEQPVHRRLTQPYQHIRRINTQELFDRKYKPVIELQSKIQLYLLAKHKPERYGHLVYPIPSFTPGVSSNLIENSVDAGFITYTPNTYNTYRNYANDFSRLSLRHVLSSTDKLRCFNCSNIIYNLEVGDEILLDHFKHFGHIYCELAEMNLPKVNRPHAENAQGQYDMIPRPIPNLNFDVVDSFLRDDIH